MNTDFNRQAGDLDAVLSAEQARLQLVLDDPASSDDLILAQAEKVSLAHVTLMRRAGEHVIAMRGLLPEDKCACFTQYSRNVVCGSGAGGRGVTTDCHDASGADGGNFYGSPHCYTGTTILGFSTGLQYRF